MPPTGRTVVVLFLHAFVEVNESETESKLRSNCHKKAKESEKVKECENKRRMPSCIAIAAPLQ